MSISTFLKKWKHSLSGDPEKIFMRRVHTVAPQHRVEMAEDFLGLNSGVNTAANKLAREIVQSA